MECEKGRLETVHGDVSGLYRVIGENENQWEIGIHFMEDPK